MYQVNYNGLKKRESYDEIVALLENDPTLLKYPDRTKGKRRRYPYIPDEFNARIKYPDRVATQILNSPYMKQIDSESLMDLQNQQDQLNKENLKQVVLKAIAESSGIPHFHAKHIADRARSGSVVAETRRQLHDIAVGEDHADVASEFRA